MRTAAHSRALVGAQPETGAAPERRGVDLGGLAAGLAVGLVAALVFVLVAGGRR